MYRVIKLPHRGDTMSVRVKNGLGNGGRGRVIISPKTDENGREITKNGLITQINTAVDELVTDMSTSVACYVDYDALSNPHIYYGWGEIMTAARAHCPIPIVFTLRTYMPDHVLSSDMVTYLGKTNIIYYPTSYLFPHKEIKILECYCNKTHAHVSIDTQRVYFTRINFPRAEDL